MISEDGNMVEAGISYEDMEKIYVTHSLMPKAIKEIVLLAPLFNNFNTTDSKKNKVLKDSLKQSKWNVLYPEIIETLETKGDFYAYWYYEKDNPIPRIKVLESKNMKEIVLDSNNEPIGYIYEEMKVNKTINEENGTTTPEVFKVQMIFKKGQIRVNDPFTYPDKGYRVFLNKDYEKDVIRLIHIPSFKKQNQEFSTIPAIDYIDSALLMDNITSDLRYINRLAGFPINWAIDLDIDWENSSLIPGGVVNAQTNQRALDNSPSRQGKLQQAEIQNELKSLQFERDIVNKDYAKKTSLIREELEEVMGSSDSSRVLAQLRLLLSNKFEKYFGNIQKGFTDYFISVLKSHNLYEEDEDRCISFEEPDIFINTSVFDSLAILNTKLALGMTTMMEEWDNKELSESSKEQRIKNINREKVLGKEDVSIDDSMKQEQLSNEYKQDTNIKNKEELWLRK